MTRLIKVAAMLSLIAGLSIGMLIPRASTNSQQSPCTVNLTGPSRGHAALLNNRGEGTQIGQNYILFPTTPPTPSYSNGKITPNSDVQILFEARANRVEYNYVVSNQYYNATTAATAATN